MNLLLCVVGAVLLGGSTSLSSEILSQDLQPESVNLLQSHFSVVVNGSSSSRDTDKVPGSPAAAPVAPGPRDPLSLAGVEMLSTDTSTSPASVTTTLVIILALIAVGVAAMFSIYVGKAPSPMDCLVWACCLGIVMVTGIGMWGPVAGGAMPPAVWFGWHPPLMASATMCLMVLGRWAYATESPLGTKADRRRVHRAFMILSVIAMVIGYVAIFKAHLPARKFFGYYHLTQEWATWQRVVHIYLGYATILLTISQAVMGLAKYEYLKEGEKVFTFHGTLGKAIITMAGAAVVMGTWAQPWDSGVSVLMGALTAGCVTFGTIWPKPEYD